MISKVIDISLTHDYKIMDNVIEGDFLLSGTYKMTEASVVNEEFIYNIPFSIAISEEVNKETINLVLHDFKYEIKGDVMTIKVELDMSCEEKKTEINEFEFKKNVFEYDEEKYKQEIEKSIDEIIEEHVDRDLDVLGNEKDTEKEEAKESIISLTNKVKNSNDTVTYKVYIVRENDTIDAIASKYNVTINDLNDYNEIDTISIGDKIVIPYVKNE